MFEYMIRKYSHGNYKKIKKMLLPLENHLAIKHFSYYKITNEGQHHTIGSNLSFGEYFYSNKLYLNCPFLLHPSNYETGASLSKGVGDSNFQETQKQINDNCGIEIGLTLIEKTQDGIEGFCFASNVNMPSAETLYVNEMPLLKHFVRMFKEEFKETLLKINDDNIDLSKITGHNFYAQKNDLVVKVKDRELLLKKMGIELPYHITKSQKEVAKLISNGYTAKDIAKLLKRSPRTIESYIEEIKDIFYCGSKPELILKTQELATLGYFQ